MLNKTLYTENGEWTEGHKKALDHIAFEIKSLFEMFQDKYDNTLINHLIQATSNAECCQRDLVDMSNARRNRRK